MIVNDMNPDLLMFEIEHRVKVFYSNTHENSLHIVFEDGPVHQIEFNNMHRCWSVNRDGVWYVMAVDYDGVCQFNILDAFGGYTPKNVVKGNVIDQLSLVLKYTKHKFDFDTNIIEQYIGEHDVA